jgi:hypothetical protein
MEWIEGFERVGGAPHLVVVSLNCERRLIPFRHLRSAAPMRRGARYVDLSGVALNDFTECDPYEYLDLAGLDVPVSANHRVYALQLPAVRLLIPAAVLLLGLLASIWHLAPWLSSAATLDRLAVPTFDDDKPTVTFFPGSISGGRDKGCTQERFLWLTGFPSARDTWNSVALNVAAGRLALDMPRASIEGSAKGLSRGGTVLVTRLHVNELTPTEPPFRSATVLAGRTFKFSPRTELISANRPDALADATLRPHGAGWHLTDEEWAQVCSMLDVRSVATARSRIDEMLLKLGTGRAWDDVNRKGDARSYYLRLKRQGRWEQIRNLLVELRTHKA